MYSFPFLLQMLYVMNPGIATPKKEKKHLTLLESDVGHALHVLGLGKHVQW